MLLQHSRKPVHEKFLPKCLRADEEVLAPLGGVVMSWCASISMHLLIVQNHWFDRYFEHLSGSTTVFKEAFSPTWGSGQIGPLTFSPANWTPGKFCAEYWFPGKLGGSKLGPWKMLVWKIWSLTFLPNKLLVFKDSYFYVWNTQIQIVGSRKHKHI